MCEAANAAAKELMAALNPYAARLAVGLLLEAMGGRWQSQAAALTSLAALARRAQTQVAHCTLDIVPKVSGGRALVGTSRRGVRQRVGCSGCRAALPAASPGDYPVTGG